MKKPDETDKGVCAHCGEEVPGEQLFKLNDELICEDCYMGLIDRAEHYREMMEGK